MSVYELNNTMALNNFVKKNGISLSARVCRLCGEQRKTEGLSVKFVVVLVYCHKKVVLSFGIIVT